MDLIKEMLGNEWTISPAGGSTGEAYIAENEDKTLFLKRNSSPFLAVLSAAGFVPKLVWTRRLENGDVLTAQEWVAARSLEPKEMASEEVATFLNRIHSSKELLYMLTKLGISPLEPKELLQTIVDNLTEEFANHKSVIRGLEYLEKNMPTFNPDDLVVCHSDLNHHNWLLTETDDLFLIDWDEAIIADKAFDLGMFLVTYIDQQDWEHWLSLYGISLTDELTKRMNWYVVAQTIIWLKDYSLKEDDKQANKMEKLLERIV
ncbi:phosphotransferase family protein [Bacillus sp. RG28]|uniref:Phosphotransferase family protein n=1 Tax=Gottfriedia endophytica TaxID=2820819 RepID=A0A940NSR6_9BACI|nr:phosphotransferase family protein [Gottfriedia endophytica]MBP0726367.1 phosphotransferase family protein [Gottfriedia endophytica]